MTELSASIAILDKNLTEVDVAAGVAPSGKKFFGHTLVDAGGNSLIPANGALPISVAALPLPAGAAQDTSLQSIIALLAAQIDLATSVWTDPTVNPPLFFLMRQSVNEGTGVITTSWVTPAGVAAAPTVANLIAVSGAKGIATQTTLYTATAASTGVAVNDILIHTFGIDTSTTPASFSYAFWFNAGPSTSGTVLATAPTAGTYIQALQQIGGKVGIQVGGADVANGNPVPVFQAGGNGTDFSVNAPALPALGGNFASSGPYSGYVLVQTIAASATRRLVDIENLSGGQIIIVRDDGTATGGNALVNASIISLAGGSGIGSQGGYWNSQTFKGRLQVFAPSSPANPQISMFQD